MPLSIGQQRLLRARRPPGALQRVIQELLISLGLSDHPALTAYLREHHREISIAQRSGRVANICGRDGTAGLFGSIATETSKR